VTAATYIRSERTIHRNAGPDVLAMVPGEGRVHLLSGPAAMIWDILERGAAIADMVHEVAGLYGRPARMVRSSVEDCVRRLVEYDLVEERRA
jgi:hypothetical protein